MKPFVGVRSPHWTKQQESQRTHQTETGVKIRVSDAHTKRSIFQNKEASHIFKAPSKLRRSALVLRSLATAPPFQNRILNDGLEHRGAV